MLFKLLKKERKLATKYNDLIEDFTNGEDCGQEIQKVKHKLKLLRQDIVTEMRKDLSERVGDRYEVHVIDTTWQ